MYQQFLYFLIVGEGQKSILFFHNFFKCLVDLSVGIKLRLNFGYLSEKREQIDLVGLSWNSSISFGNRCASHVLWIVWTLRKIHSGISEIDLILLVFCLYSFPLKKGKIPKNHSFSCWISIWLICLLWSKSSFLMGSER